MLAMFGQLLELGDVVELGPKEMLVIRSSMISTTTGSRCSAISFCAVSNAATISAGSYTRGALQRSPSATLVWSTP